MSRGRKISFFCTAACKHLPLWWLVVLMGYGYPAFAQNANQFETYSQEEGLSNNFVISLVQDHLGFIWIGTENGLNRFDGDQFTVFRNDPEDEGSLKGNFVWALFEDSLNRLWVATDIGLYRLNRKSETFVRIPLSPSDSLGEYQVRAITEDRQKTIWVGTFNDGVKRVMENHQTGEISIEKYLHNPLDTNSIVSNRIADLLADGKGHLWISSNLGLDRLIIESGQIEHFQPQTAVSGSPGIKPPTGHLQFGLNGKVIVATYDGGLFQVNEPASRPLRNNYTRYFAPGRSGIFADKFIREFTRDSDHEFWVGTANGLFHVDLLAGASRHYYHDPLQVGTLSFDLIRALYQDDLGNLWVGTYGGGLNRRGSRPKAFRFYTKNPADPGSISNAQVRSIQADDQGYLWVGTLGGGLDKLKFDPGRGWVKVQQFRHDPLNPNSLTGNQIITIVKDRTGKLWIGTNGSGLNCLDPVTGRIRRFTYDPDDPESISHNRIWALEEDRLGFIWVGTFNNGFNRLDPETGKVNRYLFDPNSFGELSMNETRAIFEDHQGYLWMGTPRGLFRFDPETDQIESFLSDASNPHSLSNNWIWVIFEDRENNLWVGTNLGLNRYDREHKSFVHYSEKDGLPSNAIYGILEDDRGRLWISTDNGLAYMLRHARQENTFRAYTGIDDLGGDAFLPKAFFKDQHSGQLYFGGLHGFTEVYPERIQVDSTMPRVVLSRFTKFNPQQNNGKAGIDNFIGNKKEITLSHQDKAVTFELADISYGKMGHFRYEYQLEGFSQQWIPVSDSREISFTALAPGTYTLRVKGVNADNITLPGTDLLEIKVKPPWWKSWWAYTLYALTLIGIVLTVYRFQLKRQWERRENIQLKNLNAFKNRLYTYITHEFRTPLTVIGGMVEQIQNAPEKYLQKGLKMIERNNDNMLNLVNQILDLRKLESGKLNLKMIQGNIVAYLRYIVESFDSLGESRGVKLHFLNREKSIYMDYDKEKVLRIMSNLLSNAIKYTPRGGDVYVTVGKRLSTGEDASPPEPESLLLLTVKDTGIGIPKEEIPFIFERFYRADAVSNMDQSKKREGAGIGLSLTKELIGILEGRIEVTSEVGKGTTFQVALPIRREAPVVEETAFDQAGKRESERREPEARTEQVAAIASAAIDRDLLSTGAPGDARKLRLLVIEDNREVIQYLQTLLEEDYRFSIARNGQEGIDKALTEIPDIIISDVMMPLKDGFEVCETLKTDERTSHIPIILLTAKTDDDSRIAGLERGADAYLPKPFNQKELSVRLRKLHESRIQLQARYANLAPPQTKSKQKPSPTAIHAQTDAFINRVRKIIEKRMKNKEFGIPELCKEVGMSRSQLHLKIKALTNRSTSHFVRGVRLQKARALLREGNLNISEVAGKVGFNDPAYFSRTFTEEFGLSPRDFLKNPTI